MQYQKRISADIKRKIITLLKKTALYDEEFIPLCEICTG